MIRKLALVFLICAAAGCSGGDGSSFGLSNIGDDPAAECSGGVVTLLPGPKNCQGLSVRPSDLVTPSGSYWDCRTAASSGDRAVESKHYFFSDGTYREEPVRRILIAPPPSGSKIDLSGRRLSGKWSLDAGTCVLTTRTDFSKCEITVEFQVAQVSADSLTLRRAEPVTFDNIVPLECRKK